MTDFAAAESLRVGALHSTPRASPILGKLHRPTKHDRAGTESSYGAAAPCASPYRQTGEIHRPATNITVPLRYLVREVELVAKDGRQYLGDRPMILMRIVARRPDDDVG